MKARSRWLWALLVVAGLTARDASAYALSSSVVGNGGGASTGASNGVLCTAGQAVIGNAGAAAYQLCAGFWCAGGYNLLAVIGDPAGHHPSRLELGPAVPNPTSGGVRFSLALPARARVDLRVFDVSGRGIATIVQEPLEAGTYILSWNGVKSGGARAGPGIYFARLDIDGHRGAIERSVVILR